jgi:translation initiation factor IF-3
MFRGREMAHTELGRKILDRLVEDLAEVAVVESTPKQDGRNMVMVIAPTKKHDEKPAPGEGTPVEPTPTSPAQ